MYGMKPSEYRRQKNYMAVFPRVQIERTESGEFMIYKDVSELYDWLRQNENVHAVCFDVVGLIGINEIPVMQGMQSCWKPFAELMMPKNQRCRYFDLVEMNLQFLFQIAMEIAVRIWSIKSLNRMAHLNTMEKNTL